MDGKRKAKRQTERTTPTFCQMDEPHLHRAFIYFTKMPSAEIVLRFSRNISLHIAMVLEIRRCSSPWNGSIPVA